MFDALKAMHARIASRRISDLFAADPERANRFSIRCGDLLLDYSKTQLDTGILRELIALCDVCGLSARRKAMFSGERINKSEDRAVLHVALRKQDSSPILVDGTDVMPGVAETLERMRCFARAVRGGEITGTGGWIRDVVNIGIGGSDLGPAMTVSALAPYCDGPQCHFVSNVDGAHIADTLSELDPTRTLLIVASKTFTTIETMANARTARRWLELGGGDVARQVVALSSNLGLTAEFGVPRERVFGFADWVGGRYSIWGPIGLPLMLAIGPGDFNAFLRGGDDMDRHFMETPWPDSLPVLLALVGLWHHQVCGYPTRAVLPYDQRLARLPAYLQQLEMESNGKAVAMDGTGLPYPTAPVVWGEPGTPGQHAFFQMLHQGTTVVPCEFMVAATGHEPELAHQHRLLVANCLAQSEALMKGRDLAEAQDRAAVGGKGGEARTFQAAHRVFPGNRPSTTLVFPRLTPFVLGQIVALYEHRVFVEGTILGINSFDQWGVELGKELANTLGPVIEGTESVRGRNASTAALVRFVHAHGGSAN